MKDIDQLTRQYLDGRLSRRRFFEKTTAMLGSYAVVHHYLEESGLASGAIAQMESARAGVETKEIRFPSAQFSIIGSLSVPATGTPAPAVLVLHENRGLNEHIRDVARRFATEGFVALAPDLLSRLGGTAAAGSPDAARQRIREVSVEEAMADLLAAHRYLNGLPEVGDNKVGSVGFCWGGARSFRLATADPELGACVVFYGSPPPEELLDRIPCPVLGLYGETDRRITSTVESTARAMEEKGKSFKYKVYPGAGHAFFNDTGRRYNESAAHDAWSRALAHFRKHL